MNDLVRNCVESRKSAIFNAYDVKNENNLSRIEEFFTKLENFANDYNDVMEFENAFASSELNQEYMTLFTEIATTESPKNIDMNQYNQNPNELKAEEIGEMVADEVVEGIT